MPNPLPPTLAASGAYSPPNTVPVLVSGVDITRNVTYFAFNVFNTDTKQFSMVNVTSSNDNVMALGADSGNYLIYVSTGASVSPATILVLTLKIAYTDGTVTAISQELSTMTAPEEPDLREACIRVDSDSGYVAMVAPANTNNWTGANAGIVYYTEYVDPSGQTQVESHFTPVEDSEQLIIDEVTYIIFPVILVPAETGYIAVQYQYYFNGQAYIGPMSSTASYSDTQTPLPPINVASQVTNYTIAPTSAPLFKIGATVSWAPPVLDEFTTIESYSIFRDGEFLVEVSGNVLTYSDNVVDYGSSYIYGVCANSQAGSSTTTLAPSLTMPSVVAARSASAAIVTPTGVYARMAVTVNYPLSSVSTSAKYMFGAEIVVEGLDDYVRTTEIQRTMISTISQIAYIDVSANQTLIANVRLFAENEDGDRFFSDIVQTNEVSTSVVSPINVTVTQLAATAAAPSVRVAWEYPANSVPLEAFLLEYTDNSGNTVLSAPLSPNSRDVTMSNLAVDRTYSYRVIAVATDGIESQPSAQVSIYIAPPGAVVALTNSYTGETNTLVLNWNRASNYGTVPPQYYSIEISNQGSVIRTFQLGGSFTSTSLNGAGFLYPGRTYIATVISIPYLLAEAPESYEPLSSSTEFDVPGVPDVASVVATPVVDNYPQLINVAWSKPENDYIVTQYLVQRQIDGGAFEWIASVPNTASPDFSYTDDISQQPMGQSYVYKIISADNDGNESTGTNSNNTGDIYYPASAPTSLSILAHSLVVNATFSNPVELNGGTGVNFTVQLFDVANIASPIATKTVVYSATQGSYLVTFAAADGVQVDHTYYAVAWLNTSYDGHSIVGNSATSNQDATGSVPIITSMNIDQSGVVSITYVSNVLQPSDSQPYTPFSAEELLYPLPLLVGSADPVNSPTRPLVNVLPSDTQIVDGLTVVHSGTIANVGNQYTLTYVPKLLTDSDIDVAASFATFVVSNRYGTQTQLHPMDIVLSSTSQPV